MISEKQFEANKRNALKSTGPNTVEGKIVASKNATKHGLLSRDAVIKGEDHQEFQAFRDRLMADLAPVEELENLLADRIVASFWKLRRAGKIENSLFNVLLDGYSNVESSDIPRMVVTKTYGDRLEKEYINPLADNPVESKDPGRIDGTSKIKSEKEALSPEQALGMVIKHDFANSNILSRFHRYESEIERSLFKALNELQRLQYLRKRNEAILSEVHEVGLNGD